LNNKKIQKFHSNVIEEVVRLDERVTNLQSAIMEHFKETLQRQTELLLLNEALMSVLKSKNYFTDEELSVEFNKIQSRLKEEVKDVQQDQGSDTNLLGKENNSNPENSGTGSSEEGKEEEDNKGRRTSNS